MDRIPTELDDLVAHGRIIPASSGDPIQRPVGAVDTEIDTTDIVAELRTEH